MHACKWTGTKLPPKDSPTQGKANPNPNPNPNPNTHSIQRNTNLQLGVILHGMDSSSSYLIPVQPIHRG
jgi:hypothetical protein